MNIVYMDYLMEISKAFSRSFFAAGPLDKSQYKVTPLTAYASAYSSSISIALFRSLIALSALSNSQR